MAESARVPDSVTLGDLVAQSARALARAGLDHRIDIYRDVDIDDPAVARMLGKRHRIRVRVRITARSLLYGPADEPPSEDPAFHDTRT